MEKVKAIDELRHEFKLNDLLEFVKLPRSTFYYHMRKIKKPDKYAEIKEKITKIYHNHKGRYGYRRVTLELRKIGIHINYKTVQRLMGVLELKSMVRIKKYKSYKGKVGKIAPNILKRDFSATKPYTKWVTDTTEISLFGQKLYLSPILDLYNREIISYNISMRPTFDQIIDMLDKAFQKIPDRTGLILHSDQGWQYQMKNYQHRLKLKGVIQSMSRKGNCLDNSVMENFFGILKSELLYLQKFENVDHFINELHGYIYYYNNHRLKAKLKGLSPVEYRIQSSLVS